MRHAPRCVLSPHGEYEGHGVHGPQRDVGGLGEDDAIEGDGIGHDIAHQQRRDDDAGAGDEHAIQGVFRGLLPEKQEVLSASLLQVHEIAVSPVCGGFSKV